MAGFTKRYGPEGPLIDARLTRLIPVGKAAQIEGSLRPAGLALASVQLWTHFVALDVVMIIASFDPFERHHEMWRVTDDIGTVYRAREEIGRENAGRLHSIIRFSPAPPPRANTISVQALWEGGVLIEHTVELGEDPAVQEAPSVAAPLRALVPLGEEMQVDGRRLTLLALYEWEDAVSVAFTLSTECHSSDPLMDHRTWLLTDDGGREYRLSEMGSSGFELLFCDLLWKPAPAPQVCSLTLTAKRNNQTVLSREIRLRT
jgi:hypothetical protein